MGSSRNAMARASTATKAQDRQAQEQSLLSQKLIETGERERLKQHVMQTLNEIGWRDDLKKHCVQYLQNRGVEKVSIEELTMEIAPHGRAMVPDALKTEVFNRIRTFAE